MTERSLEILEAAVREFIETGEPVSSSVLFDKYDFGIRPAMIRAELSWLTEAGYLEQPYHSAGRVPSNKGYEFFANRVLEQKKPRKVREEIPQLSKTGLEDILAALVDELGLATAAHTHDGLVRKEGLETLMQHIDWGPRDEMMQIIRDFESIEQRLGALRERLFAENFLDVFIGKKSPVTQSNELAVMAGDYDVGGQRVILFAIGPKRMDYEKAAAIFRKLKNQ
jgi:transcriptional regulator of heat shock response